MKRNPVRSTSIAAISYDDRSQILQVEFTSGRVYEYEEVPEFLFRALSAARSKGHYFNQSIRDRYTWRELDGGKEP